MVPLKPKELKRDARRSPAPPPSAAAARPVASTGMRNDDRLDDTIDDKWAFNLRATRTPPHHEASPDFRLSPAARFPAVSADPRS